MAKKKILMKKSILNKILTDIYIPFYSKEIINRNIEDEVDDCIKKLLEPIFNEFIRVKKQEIKILTIKYQLGMEKVVWENQILCYIIIFQKKKYL